MHVIFYTQFHAWLDNMQFGTLADVDVVPCDISVAGRVLSTFPEKLKASQRVPDNLSYLGEICKTVSMFVCIQLGFGFLK